MERDKTITSTPSIISHIKNNNGTWEIQTNDEHAENVACLAESFADKFGMGKFGRIMGLLHDKGKEQTSFQQHIRRVVMTLLHVSMAIIIMLMLGYLLLRAYLKEFPI